MSGYLIFDEILFGFPTDPIFFRYPTGSTSDYTVQDHLYKTSIPRFHRFDITVHTCVILIFLKIKNLCYDNVVHIKSFIEGVRQIVFVRI